MWDEVVMVYNLKKVKKAIKWCSFDTTFAKIEQTVDWKWVPLVIGSALQWKNKNTTLGQNDFCCFRQMRHTTI